MMSVMVMVMMIQLGIDSWDTPVGARRHKVAGSEDQRGGGKDKGNGM